MNRMKCDRNIFGVVGVGWANGMGNAGCKWWTDCRGNDGNDMGMNARQRNQGIEFVQLWIHTSVRSVPPALTCSIYCFRFSRRQIHIMPTPNPCGFLVKTAKLHIVRLWANTKLHTERQLMRPAISLHICLSLSVSVNLILSLSLCFFICLTLSISLSIARHPPMHIARL